MKQYTEVIFKESYFSITIEHNGYEVVYVPREFGEVYSKTTRLERHMKAFKTPQGAVNFLLKQGATLQ